MMSISSTSSQTLPSTPQLTLSVIVPERNGGAKLRKSLSALTKTIPPPVELIVVAEGDTDESWRIAEEFMGKVLRIPEPQGPARARNWGARTVQGEILFFIDADDVISPDSIHQVETAFRNEPLLVALFGSYDDEPIADLIPQVHRGIVNLQRFLRQFLTGFISFS